VLAEAAALAGDSIGAENYYQHAEHYFRVMSPEPWSDLKISVSGYQRAGALAALLEQIQGCYPRPNSRENPLRVAWKAR
jgi:hypothetical protein